MPFSLPAQNLSPAITPLAGHSPLTGVSPLAGRFPMSPAVLPSLKKHGQTVDNHISEPIFEPR
jgi:hypothetical protein